MEHVSVYYKPEQEQGHRTFAISNENHGTSDSDINFFNVVMQLFRLDNSIGYNEISESRNFAYTFGFNLGG